MKIQGPSTFNLSFQNLLIIYAPDHSLLLQKMVLWHMRKNSHIFLLFFLLSASVFANEPLIKTTKAPLSVALPLLQSIDQYAIVLGSGPTHMYAFIDPICPRSREFVSMIVESEKMRERYTYHFFYYELTRFHSINLIGTIYSDKEPLEVMKKVMVEEKKIPQIEVFSLNIRNQIKAINGIAKKLNIDKRPYLFVVKPQKGDK